jgi:hypothetical protein
LPAQLDPAAEDAARLRAWLDEQAVTLRDCAQPNVHGRAMLSLDLSSDGHVRKAELLAAGALPAQTSECILGRARALHAPIAAENRLLVNLVL